MASNPPEPISKRGRLGKFLHIQHSTQCLIILNVANLIQVKTVCMLHQDKGLDEFRGLNSEGQQPRLLFGWGEVLIDSLRHVHAVQGSPLY